MNRQMDGAGQRFPEMGHFECRKLRATTTARVGGGRMNEKGVRGAAAASRLGRK